MLGGQRWGNDPTCPVRQPRLTCGADFHSWSWGECFPGERCRHWGEEGTPSDDSSGQGTHGRERAPRLGENRERRAARTLEPGPELASLTAADACTAPRPAGRRQPPAPPPPPPPLAIPARPRKPARVSSAPPARARLAGSATRLQRDPCGDNLHAGSASAWRTLGRCGRASGRAGRRAGGPARAEPGACGRPAPAVPAGDNPQREASLLPVTASPAGGDQPGQLPEATSLPALRSLPEGQPT